MTWYNQGTRIEIAGLQSGIYVRTAELGFAVWGEQEQADYFTVYNRIIIHHLFLEVGATALVGATNVIRFNFTSTVPIVAADDLSIDSTASIHGHATGRRTSLTGTTTGTGLSVDSTVGISLGPTNTMMVGHARSAAVVVSVGSIGSLTATADLTAGTGFFGLVYSPVDRDAYVETLM